MITGRHWRWKPSKLWWRDSWRHRWDAYLWPVEMRRERHLGQNTHLKQKTNASLTTVNDRLLRTQSWSYLKLVLQFPSVFSKHLWCFYLSLCLKLLNLMLNAFLLYHIITKNKYIHQKRKSADFRMTDINQWHKLKDQTESTEIDLKWCKHWKSTWTELEALK